MKKVLVLLLAAALAMNLSGCFLAFMGDDETSQTITDNSDTPKDEESKEETQDENVARVGQTVTGEKWAISLQSAKVFNEVASEYFTDTPEDGNVYLVLFFDVQNVSDEDDYFNYFNIESYVDGYNQSIKILMNKPDGVDTLTGDVAAGKKLKGQLAWEVPEGWTELEVSYKDDPFGNEKDATFVVTPDDITA